MEAEHYQQRYVMLNDNNPTNIRPPPQRRNVPRYHEKKRGNCCVKCVWCCFCFWLALIIILAGLVVILYSLLQPKPPVYNVDGFDVNAFNPGKDMSFYAEFIVSVVAKNPNEHIGLTYGEDSSVEVTYKGSNLCSGKLPAYHQPHSNTTTMKVLLKGKSEFGSGLHEALKENKKTGKIPLLVMVKAPVSVVLKDIPLREIVVYVNCSLVVDNLAPKKKAGILSKQFTYAIGLY